MRRPLAGLNGEYDAMGQVSSVMYAAMPISRSIACRERFLPFKSAVELGLSSGPPEQLSCLWFISQQLAERVG
ncbi:hypothetical protein [Lentibacter algarum]|uniref:hypothetical protein n=1 Tax=Lentibacter algarum TaxID=576131 RepID=UPI0026F04A37|nr:hypothetical protein [Lentibacter algarum]